MSRFQIVAQAEYDTFNSMLIEYENLNSENGGGAYTLAINSLSMANRWAEIAADARKICKDNNWMKTEFSDWCYRKWRVLNEIHTHCRMIWKNAEEGSRYNNR